MVCKLFKLGGIGAILIFLYMDMFDTIGTLVGVGTASGFMKNGKLPRANKALLSVGSLIYSQVYFPLPLNMVW